MKVSITDKRGPQCSLQKLNNYDYSDFDGIRKILKELFGKSGDLQIRHFIATTTEILKQVMVLANYKCTILDSARVVIGENVLLGPNVVISTSGHAIHPIYRKNPNVCTYAKEIKIGNQVWIGANS